jgi:DNA repair exonuclease SbcCD ATPase subunit
MEALTFGLTGSILGDDVKEDLLSWGSDKGYVEIKFSHEASTYTLKRNINGSKAVLTENGTKKASTKKEIDAIMKSMLTMRPSLYDKVVFIAPDELDAPLRMAHAKRQEFFNQLFETDKCEALRSLLLSRLQALPPPVDYSEEMKTLSREKQQLTKSVIEAETTLTGITAELTELPPSADIVVKLSLPDKDKADKDAYAAAHALSEEAAGINRTINELNGLKEPKVMPPDMLRAFDAHTRMESMLKIYEDKKAALPMVSIPCSDEDIAQLRTRLNELSAEKVVTEKSLQLAHDGKCPTCGSVFSSDAIPALETSIQAINKGIKETTDALSAAVYAQKATLDLQAAEEQFILAKKEVPQGFDVRSFKELQACIANQSMDHTQWLTKTASIPALRARVDDINKRISEIKPAESITSEERVELLAVLTKIESLNAADKDTRVFLASATTRLEYVDKELTKIASLEAAAASIEEKREIMTKARDALHRDAIPGVRTRAGLGVINVKIEEWLKICQAPFGIRLNDDSDFVSVVDGVTRKITALSTGQRRLAAVAFRLAIAELFAGSIGILSLDEPAAFLDDAVISSLVTALERAAAKAVTMGMSIVVSTNETTLIRSFTTTTDVTKL